MASSVVSRRENAHISEIWSLDWSGDYVISGSLDETTKVWKPAGDSLESAYNGPKVPQGALGVAGFVESSVNPETSLQLAAASSLSSGLTVWNLRDGQVLHNFDASPLEAWALAFSRDGQFLYSTSRSGAVHTWAVGPNTDTKGKVSTLLDHTPESTSPATASSSSSSSSASSAAKKAAGSPAVSLAVEHHKNQLAAGNMKGAINLADIERGKRLSQLDLHLKPVRALAYLPLDLGMLISGSDDGVIGLFDASNGGALIGSIEAQQGWIVSVAASPTGRTFATGGADGTVKIWEVSTRKMLHSFSAHTDAVWGLAFNHLGNRLVSGSADRSIVTYSIA